MAEEIQKSGGGAANQGGINYQNRVAAWVCVAMMAVRPAKRIHNVLHGVDQEWGPKEVIEYLNGLLAESLAGC